VRVSCDAVSDATCGRSSERACDVRVMHANEPWIPDADAGTIDDRIVKLAAKKGELEVEIGRWLIAAKRKDIARGLGFGSFYEYVSRRLGWGPRMTDEKLRVAESLESLPKLQELVRSGDRPWSAAREITRVATPDKEAEWIEKTERKTVRQIEQMVAGRKQGDGPSDPRDPLLIKRRLVVELPGEIFALMSEALVSIRRAQPGITHEEMWRTVAERVLSANDPSDPNAPAFQITVTRCASCERTWQHAGCDTIEVPPSVGARACCDGEITGVTMIDEGIAEPSLSTDVRGPAASAAHVDATEEKPRAELDESTHVGGERKPLPEPDEALAACLASYLENGGWRGVVNGVSRVLGVSLKSMTPRLKAKVRARDGRKCSVPGCRNVACIEYHHLAPRSKGGPNTPINLLPLCARHHTSTHEGRLAIERSPSGEIIFRHENGTLYGSMKLRSTPPGAKRASAPSGTPTWDSPPRASVARPALAEQPMA
jgi:hypothetical protein